MAIGRFTILFYLCMAASYTPLYAVTSFLAHVIFSAAGWSADQSQNQSKIDTGTAVTGNKVFQGI